MSRNIAAWFCCSAEDEERSNMIGRTPQEGGNRRLKRKDAGVFDDADGYIAGAELPMQQARLFDIPFDIPDSLFLSGLYAAEEEEGGGEEEIMELDSISMEEDVYGFAITSLIRDTRMLAQASGHNPGLRYCRLVLAQLFVLACVALQAYILIQTKLLVTAMHVHQSREVYDQYEFHMYGGKEANMELTVHGNHRGLPSFFKQERFDTLPDDVKESICLVALAHPKFFMAILCIWTLTCLGEIKACVWMIWCLWCTPTIPTMRYATIGHTKYAGDSYELKAALPKHLHGRVEALEPNDRLVIGITTGVRRYVVFLIGLPRLLTTLFMFWLGCRWLVATSGFEEILLNAVALEFVLLLKDLMYKTVVPMRNKQEVRMLKVLPAGGRVRQKASFSLFFGSFGLFLIAVCWVYIYTYHWQRAIPNFRWDVRDACNMYVKQHFGMGTIDEFLNISSDVWNL